MTENKNIAACSLRLARAVLGVLLLALVATRPALGAEQWRWSGVERVVAISDVHGAYEAMESTLKNAGVIDESLNWAAGNTHLVITGDMVDRGPDSRPVMDLVMRLEPEAEAAGGKVHLLLGNHEVMNLVGDLRYVSAEEYAAFAADESAQERDNWFRAYSDKQMLVSNNGALRAEFNEYRPQGFFGHRRAFRSDGKYGSWLLGKPLIVVINDVAYVHGGLSPRVADVGLEGINGVMRDELRRYVDAVGVLNDAGLLDPVENFYNHEKALRELPAGVEQPPELASAIDTVLGLGSAAIHGQESPLWYRGNVACGPLIEIDRIGPALAAIDASRVVIGHTPTLTRRVLSRLDGRVIEIDTGALNAYYGGAGNALVIEGDSMAVINEKGSQPVSVVAHPRRVGIRDEAVGAEQLEAILAHGEIVSSEDQDSGLAVVKVSHDGVTVEAVFTPNPRDRGFVPELAAYRLDRVLGLDMVPVTVARAIDGKAGTLQFRPPATMDEAVRREKRRGSDAWCPLPDQWGAMYIFDTLIYNPGRSQQHMLYSQDNWQLILPGNSAAFDTSRSRPPYLKDVALDIGAAWQNSLSGLTDAVLNEQFGDVLDKRRRAALGKRRDALLKDAAGR